MIRIGILGVGGVGGYFGGRLAGRYSGAEDVQVIFIARGETKDALQKSGLRLVDNGVEEIVHPFQTSDNPGEIGKLDVLFCCTKTYGLAASIASISACIDESTIVVPLQNGVGSAEELKLLLPPAYVLNGCVYLVAKVTSPGVAQRSGKVGRMLFGDGSADNERLRRLEFLLRDAGIDATYASNIAVAVWSKFVFIASVATLTSAENIPVGAILANEYHTTTLRQLMEEVKAVAVAKQVQLPATAVDDALAVAASLPFDTYSSMHNDVQNGHQTEVEALTGYIVNEGHRFGIDTQVFAHYYAQLKQKTTSTT